ncbi:hypothetical protein C5022_000007 [Pseudomonas phage vB_PaeP_130_113]|uniref:Uncharacterized protein n=3 Tax=Phikmvvirus TaxID=477967 RepID=A0A2R4P9B4_9CAUD|nr:hypothetical protein HOT07_gp07 [Pseudomonas phage vB_PaeP_130_113]AOZ64505.1 hypothetical protein BB757_005 [Pseudomonas phage vB_Pae-TbilisiM32]AVX47610.1 hypothetical protein C5022_000007 [Pseudomonas phage vB_PaeP_130_113]QHZ59722.1 hypothetical protein vBPaePPE3_004 [Pseudomonas phage vB_PaeP_PE3]
MTQVERLLSGRSAGFNDNWRNVMSFKQRLQRQIALAQYSRPAQFPYGEQAVQAKGE